MTMLAKALQPITSRSCIQGLSMAHQLTAQAAGRRLIHVMTPLREKDRIVSTTHSITTIHQRLPSGSRHPSQQEEAQAVFAASAARDGPSNPNIDSREHLPPAKRQAKQTFSLFDLSGGSYVVTGGAQGLGLSMAEALAEAGGAVYCLDYQPEPSQEFLNAQAELRTDSGGQLHFMQVDVRDEPRLNDAIANIAAKRERLDGAVAAAGVQQLCPAMDYSVADINRMLGINTTGVFLTARAAAREMYRYKTRGSICLVASMSGMIANKGLVCPIYNCSKAAVIQMARSLSMEWARVNEDGTGGLRVNALCPGNILTPMVLRNFEEVPGLKEKWEGENMMGRLAHPEEFKGATLFLLSKHSSYMTGSSLVMDAGYTAW